MERVRHQKCSNLVGLRTRPKAHLFFFIHVKNCAPAYPLKVGHVSQKILRLQSKPATSPDKTLFPYTPNKLLQQ
ncbi:unnamed protein product [Sphenostylis stenocarpa]|uniref:Uncharacterized protein n=1 Tax=Sphenostylis stenocarpa TaxID=92480 RepID=A0AA86SB48_9FABA|nr:unnamed protein product [Sphenostylis stenocarpa]